MPKSAWRNKAAKDEIESVISASSRDFSPARRERPAASEPSWFAARARLQAMQPGRNFEIRKVVFAVERAVIADNIEKLDGEDVGRAPQFVDGENQRRGLALPHPPGDRRAQGFQMRGAGSFDDARKFRSERPAADSPVTASHRAPRISVGARGFLQLFDQLYEFFSPFPALLRQRLPGAVFQRNRALKFSPTPARPSAAERSAPEPAKSSRRPLPPPHEPPPPQPPPLQPPPPIKNGPPNHPERPATIRGAPKQHGHEPKEESYKDDEGDDADLVAIRFPWCSLSRNAGERRERDFLIGGDGLGHPAGHQRKCPAVISIAKQRNGLAAEAAHFAVGQDRLQAIANFDPILVLRRREPN